MVYFFNQDFPVRYTSNNGIITEKIFKAKDKIIGIEENGFVLTTPEGQIPTAQATIDVLKIPVNVLIKESRLAVQTPTNISFEPMQTIFRTQTPKMNPPFGESIGNSAAMPKPTATPVEMPKSPFIQIPNSNISIDRNIPNILNVLNIRKVERNEVQKIRRAQELFQRLLAGYTMPTNEDMIKIAQYSLDTVKTEKVPQTSGIGGFVRSIFGGNLKPFAGE
jgi:hypothetical protein